MHLAQSPLVVCGCAIALFSFGCSDSGAEPPTALVESSADPRSNVLVIDDGFDPNDAVFRGRLAGLYSITCDQMRAQTVREDVGASDGGAPAPVVAPDDAGAADGGVAHLTERKNALIASLRIRSNNCTLTPGVAPKPDPLASVAHLRARWNDVIRNSKFASSVLRPGEIDEIREAQKALGKARFHGTATAGIIAHANPNVRLVLIEELLGTVESISAGFTCFKQQEIDDNVALFSDLEVRQAYLDRPFSALDDDFRKVHARHRIGVSNESFGQLSRQALEELQAKKGCTAVDLRRYFGVLGELDSARARIHPDPDALLVKSAGNDRSRIDGSEDHPMCGMPGTPRLVVGAYDDSGDLANFTNFGRCVDAVAPGWQIVAPIPGGWLMPLSGTSFSAPLTARLVSLLAMPMPYGAAAARDLVLGMRDAQSRIPLSLFPRELLYDPQHLSNQWALTIAGRDATGVPTLINLRKLHEFESLLGTGGRRGR